MHDFAFAVANRLLCSIRPAIHSFEARQLMNPLTKFEILFHHWLNSYLREKLQRRASLYASSTVLPPLQTNSPSHLQKFGWKRGPLSIDLTRDEFLIDLSTIADQ